MLKTDLDYWMSTLEVSNPKLAKGSSLKLSTIKNIRYNAVIPRADTLEKIAQYLNIPSKAILSKDYLSEYSQFSVPDPQQLYQEAELKLLELKQREAELELKIEYINSDYRRLLTHLHSILNRLDEKTPQKVLFKTLSKVVRLLSNL